MRLLGSVEAREVVIHLAVDYNVIISRMTGRRVCLKCGTLYNAISRPPKVNGICDLDGNQLVVREDDRDDVRFVHRAFERRVHDPRLGPARLIGARVLAPLEEPQRPDLQLRGRVRLFAFQN